MENWGHSDITRFMLEHALENIAADVGGSRKDKANSLIGFLLQNPQLENEEGANVVDGIVWDLAERAIERAGAQSSWQPRPFEDAFPELGGRHFHGAVTP